jgi:uncharacterized membrane protein
MENKNVGYLILGISALIIVIIFLFQEALRDVVELSCGAAHAVQCPMSIAITQQTYLALSIAGILVIIALLLIFSKPTEKIIIKKVTEKKPKKTYDLSDLRKEDKEVFKIIQEKGAQFQADLIEKTNFGKAKMSRIIDRLEGKNLVERKRRGMTNVVVLKKE